MPFHFDSWLIYFYFYCICGWIFESGYVSIRTHKLTNRGFMKGPWLPLYGSGAVIILVATLPFQEYPAAVYFAGAAAATVLEYFTGVMMVKLFKVRYWDYSDQKLQFQGHICLTSSIAWGFLSLLMVYVVHKPVVKFVGMWNEEFLSMSTFVITILIVFDFTNAFREAMDLRALIVQAEELKQRLDDALAQQREHFNEAVEEKKEELEQAVEETREQMMEKRKHLEQTVTEHKEKIMEWREEISDEHKEHLKQKIQELERARERIRSNMEQHSRQLLLHNPGSGFRNMKEESMEIKRRLMERRRKRDGR